MESAGATGPAYRLAVDIGGTFTDVVLERNGDRVISKVLTTYDDPARGFLEGVQLALEKAGAAPADVGLIVHGTTLATNALIERKGARVALLATDGFRDTLEMAYEHRFDQYDVFMCRPTPLVPRSMRFEIVERVAANGDVLIDLDDTSVRALIPTLREADVEAVAICFMHAYANGAHEKRVRDILEAELPGVPISISSEICPEIREYDRTSTTVANAYVRPLMGRYLASLEEGMKVRGFACPLLMMMSSGTITTVETARQYPIRLVESGPAGGANLAVKVAAECGADKVLSFDMGGTTAKLCFIDDYEPQLSRSFEVAREYRFMKGSGMPVKIPVIEMVEIGSGGGSIGRITDLGVVAVGPDSAGSEPGPACYGRGGQDPTVTDADLLMGRIDPTHFAGGQVALDVESAEAALLDAVGRPLGLETHRAAAAISEMVDENMANATRIHAAESGKDVSARTIIAFGGAAPLHAARLAEKLGVSRVIVPSGAGVGSAIGFLDANYAYEIVRTRYTDMKSFDGNDITAMFDEMARMAARIVHMAVPGAELVQKRFAYMRYQGQGHEIAVDLPVRDYGADDSAEIIERFEEAYRRLFGRTVPNLIPEVISWSISVGTSHALPGRVPAPRQTRTVEPDGTREIYDPSLEETRRFGVYSRAALQSGDRISGPAIIAENETTTVVSPSFDAEIDALGYIVLTRKGSDR